MTLAINRPFTTIKDQRGIERRKVNYTWYLQRVPMWLLAISGAWGVGAYAFSSGALPYAVAIIAGCAFEAAYIGAVAIADQAHDPNDKTTDLLWWFVNLFAVIASVSSNLLFFAPDHKYANITPEVATHAIPSAILGFMYGLLLHRITSRQVARAHAEQQRLQAKQEAIDEENRKALLAQTVAQQTFEAENPYKCEFCGTRKRTQKALNGHLARCKSK